jgi:hypothetical protein
MDNNAYKMGQILQCLILDGWADEDAAVRVNSNLLGTLNPAIARATQAGADSKIAPLMEDLGDMPKALTNEQWSRFWLGFYHRRRGPGRPQGSTKPEADKRRGHEVTLSDAAWEKAQVSGNASQYIERLIIEDN